MKSIFIFRRSLRLADNTGLIECCKNSKIVFPIFIFTHEQIDKNIYKSDNAVQFMIESLIDLNTQLDKYHSKLFLFHGKIDEILTEIIQRENISSIYVNNDYTPYSKKRDEGIRNLCISLKIKFQSYEDILLHPMGKIKTISGSAFKVYSPFRKNAEQFDVKKINYFHFKNLINKDHKINGEIDFEKAKKFYNHNENTFLKGGRKVGLKILEHIENFSTYSDNSNYLNYETTHLSAYNKFGCVSIREVYHKIKAKIKNCESLINQLYWRDFFYNIINFFPENLKKSMYKDNIKWENDPKYFTAWSTGMTGFPIVDACMRQLNETGYMPNRGRLIVGSFLTKLLVTDWKKGEKYFANKLIDYDVAVNNGSWQWVAGTGVDRQQLNRIFNPWMQGMKFDSKAEYIKIWLPELKNINSSSIHNWENEYKNFKTQYPPPIINYKERRNIALKIFK